MTYAAKTATLHRAPKLKSVARKHHQSSAGECPLCRDRAPNATTVKALQDDMRNRRNAKSFDSVAALFEDLEK